MPRKISRDGLALAAYVLLALLLTWPLALRLNTHIISAGPTPGDNYEYVWKMWWVPHALLERGISPFFHPDVAYPDGYPLAYGEITPSHTFLLLPLTVLFGATAAYNVAILLSAVLTGWFMYLLARRWLASLNSADDRWLIIAAWFSGAALAFCIYRTQRIAGHLPLIDTHWLVLALLGVDRWLEKQRLRDALLAGLGVALAALSSWYYGFILVLLLPVYILAFVERDWRRYVHVRALLAGIFALVVILALCLPFLLPYLQVSSEGAAQIPLEDARFWAASPLDYLMPNPRHPLWGGVVQSLTWPFADIDMPYEFMLSVGWVTLGLAVVGWRRTTGSRWRAIKWLIVVAFVLSLGPFLTIGRLPTPIPLPVLALREVLPFAGSIRSWGRFAVLVMLGMSLLGGAGLILLLERLAPSRRALLASGTVVALLFGMWSPVPLIEVRPRPVDLWLAEQPDDAPIMQFPVEEALSGPAMLYTRYHGKPVVYGYGTYYPFLFRQRYPELLDFPNAAALDRLDEWGVHYLLVNAAQYGPAALDNQPRLRHIITLDDQAVYELLPVS